MAHLDAIRKDMVILEKSEFANLRSENAVRIKFKPEFRSFVFGSVIRIKTKLRTKPVEV